MSSFVRFEGMRTGSTCSVDRSIKRIIGIMLSLKRWIKTAIATAHCIEVKLGYESLTQPDIRLRTRTLQSGSNI